MFKIKQQHSCDKKFSLVCNMMFWKRALFSEWIWIYHIWTHFYTQHKACAYLKLVNIFRTHLVGRLRLYIIQIKHRPSRIDDPGVVSLIKNKWMNNWLATRFEGSTLCALRFVVFISCQCYVLLCCFCCGSRERLIYGSLRIQPFMNTF